nr:Lrp/AsnC ligand binding domain-containing protein [Candidatus Njordarchaeota archaeon]
MKIYIEMNVTAGKIKGILREIRRIREVKEVSAVTGHCDIIASVDVQNLESLSKIILERIQSLDGVTRTETLVCIPVE